MLKWFLLWYLVSNGSSYSNIATASAGPFNSEEACKSALVRLNMMKGLQIGVVEGLCVPSEVIPAAPGVRAQ